MLNNEEKDQLYSEFRYRFICELLGKTQRHNDLIALNGILHIWIGQIEIEDAFKNAENSGN